MKLNGLLGLAAGLMAFSAVSQELEQPPGNPGQAELAERVAPENGSPTKADSGEAGSPVVNEDTPADAKQAGRNRNRQSQVESEEWQPGSPPEELKALLGQLKAMDELLKNEDWDSLLVALEDMGRENPSWRTICDLERCVILLKEKQDYGTGYELAGKLRASLPPSYRRLDELARFIMTEKRIEERDFTLARQLALEACKLVDFNSYPLLETLAEACFKAGNAAEAVDHQDRAAKMAERHWEKQLRFVDKDLEFRKERRDADLARMHDVLKRYRQAAKGGEPEK